MGDQLTLHVKVDNLTDGPRNLGICKETYLVAEGIPYGLTQELCLSDVRPQIFRRGKFSLAIPKNFLSLEAVALIVKGNSYRCGPYSDSWEATLPQVAPTALLGPGASTR